MRPDRPPWLSVLTPSYDYARFLPSCMASVQRQDPEGEIQHVIIDDGSHDASWEVIRRNHPCAERDCVRQENQGLSPTLNHALSVATGEWVNWLNADDFLLHSAASLVRGALRAAPGADVVYGDALEVDEDGRLLRLVSQPAFTRSLFERGYNSFNVPAVFVRRDRVLAHGFDESMKLLMDLDMWLAVTSSPATVVKVDAPLAAVRRHPGQISATQRPSDVEEMRAIGRRHGIESLARAKSARAPLTSKLQHGARKLADGGWVRELRWRSRRGRDVDWTMGGESLGPDVARVRIKTVAGDR